MRPGSIPADEVHVWRGALDQPSSVVARLQALLSEPERARTAAMRLARIRDRYVVGRGLLRTLLSHYVGVRPQDLEFAYGEHGKPYLEGVGPWFNLSHSRDVALFAFSSGAEVGVDVELEHRRVEPLRIAQRFFSEVEVAALRSLPDASRARAFLACWTRKEAFIKARGDGLTLPLRSFDVTLLPGEPATVLRTEWSATEAAEWELLDVSHPETRTVAAVAMRSRGWHVVHRDASAILNSL